MNEPIATRHIHEREVLGQTRHFRFARAVRAILLGIYLLAAGFALMGCNTVEGAGKDIEGGGDAIKDAARDAKN